MQRAKARHLKNVFHTVCHLSCHPLITHAAQAAAAESLHRRRRCDVYPDSKDPAALRAYRKHRGGG